MSSLSAIYEFLFRVTDTPALGISPVTDPEIIHTLGELKATLSSTTSPPVSKVWSVTRTLGAASLDLDLTALDNGNLPNVTFDTLRVQLAIFKAAGTNAANIVITPSGVNPYLLYGTSSSKNLYPGGIQMDFFNNKAPLVATGSALGINLAGTSTDSFSAILAAG